MLQGNIVDFVPISAYTFALMNAQYPLHSVPPRSGGFHRPKHAQKAQKLLSFLARVWRWARSKNFKYWRVMFWRLVMLAIAAGVVFVAYLWFTLPDISNPRALIADQSSAIVDRNGVELYRLFDEQDRTFISGDHIPDSLKKAIVAIEDRRFYDEGNLLRLGCIDIRGIARAFVVNVFSGTASQGASTITQQLARNAFLTRHKRISRKIRELMLACVLEANYSKDELLELYLNWIPFGQNAYGVEQASQRYFGKSASGLTLAESSVLASLPQRPTYFSPYGKHVYSDVTDDGIAKVMREEVTHVSQFAPEDIRTGLLAGVVGTGSTTVRVHGRTDVVLRSMQDMEFITEAEKLAALDELETLTFESTREDIRAPHFVLWIRDQVDELLGESVEEGLLDKGGLTIETTLDWDMQQAAEKVVADRHQDLIDRFGAFNVSLLALDPATRHVLAYIGNADYNDNENGGKIDMSRAPRQPGSSFKPFVFAAAFEEGYSPSTILYDVPTKFGQDRPQNFDGLFWGLTDARHALGASRNIPAIKAFYLSGEDNREDELLHLVEQLGIKTPQETKAAIREKESERGVNPDDQFAYGYPLAIGTAETPLIEMVQAYASLADGGTFKEMVSIKRIRDRHGNILYETVEDERGIDAMDPRIAYQVTSILSDVSARPADNEFWQTVLSVPEFQTAAKTGTSNKCLERKENGKDKGRCIDLKPSDLWTIGYTPALAAGVWIGNADSSALFSTATSLTAAAPLWQEFMKKAHYTIDGPRAFEQPDGLVQPQVSRLSGQLPSECTPVELRSADIFLAEYAPKELDPACAVLEIDRVTGLLGSNACPEEALEERSFLRATSIKPERWPDWEEGLQEWLAEQMVLWELTENHSGSLLPLPVPPDRRCNPSLTPGRLIKPEVSFLFPSNNDTVPFPAFRPKLDISVGSGLRETRYEIDGKSLGTFGSGSTRPNLVMPRSVKASGKHKLTVTITDTYFNEVSDEVTIRFHEDTEAPRVVFTLPRGKLSLPSGATIRMRAEAGDGDGALKYVQFYLGTRLLSTKPKLPFEMEYSAQIRPGNYKLRAVATDVAGNTAEDVVELEITQ